MSTALTVQEQRAIAIAPKYSNEQVKLLADTIAKGCDENELKLFLEISKLSRLNPFIGQIRPVKRWNSDLGRETMVIQVGIDGYRSMASRTDELAGIEDAIYDSEEEAHPKWSKVTVFRWSHNEKIPYTATARWSEYVQKKKDGTANSMWTRMPYLMLAKCAEALALRKAFPDELAGVYTEEEMGQADNPDPSGQIIDGKQSQQEPEKKKAPPTEENITGKIEEAKPGKEGAVWVMIDKKLVVIEKKFYRDTMIVGSTLTAKVQKRNSKKVGDFYAVLAVLDNPPVAKDEVIDAEVVEDKAPDHQEPIEGLQSLFDSGAVTTANNLPKKTGIGTKAAQSIYIIARKHEEETGFTEANIKAVLAKLPIRLEHLSDLDPGMQSTFEKYARGEDSSWKELLES